MEVFKVKKDKYFDLELEIKQLSVKPGDILILKSNDKMSSKELDYIVDQFYSLVAEDQERFRDIKLFVLEDSSVDISKLNDDDLLKMGLQRIEQKE